LGALSIKQADSVFDHIRNCDQLPDRNLYICPKLIAMKPNLLFVTIITVILFSIGCSRENKDSRQLITDRIQYDVNLKNSDSTADWWIQNMDGRSREAFINMVLEKAYSGTYKTYTFFDHLPLSAEQVKAIGNRTDTLSIQRSTPPYDLYDTIMRTELRKSEILKVRFIEAWYWNEDTKQFEKEVTGICPLLDNYAPSGEYRGTQPLFWIALNDKFPFGEAGKK
jgi:hypothetical protein